MKRRALLGEMLGHNALGRGMRAHVGDLVGPLMELRVEILLRLLSLTRNGVSGRG